MTFIEKLSIISSIVTLIVFISGFSTLYENTSKSRRTTKFLIRSLSIFIFYISIPIYLVREFESPFFNYVGQDLVWFSLQAIIIIFLYFLAASFIVRLVIRLLDNLFKTLLNYDEKIGLLYACQSWVEYANNLFSESLPDMEARFKVVSSLLEHLSDYMGLEDVRFSVMVPDEEETKLEIVSSSGVNTLTIQNFRPPIFDINYGLRESILKKVYTDLTVATWVYKNPSFSPKFISNVNKSDLYKIDIYSHSTGESSCLFCFPLIFDGVKVGVLSATGRTGGALYDEIYRDFIYKSIGPLISSYLTR